MPELLAMENPIADADWREEFCPLVLDADHPQKNLFRQHRPEADV
jgi:hypothetical protein